MNDDPSPSMDGRGSSKPKPKVNARCERVMHGGEPLYIISILQNGEQAARFEVSEKEAVESYGIHDTDQDPCDVLADAILDGYIRELRKPGT